MRRILRNPFFIAIAFTVAIGTACGLFVVLITKDARDGLIMAGAIMSVILLPALLLPFLARFVPSSTTTVLDDASLEDEPVWESIPFHAHAIPKHQPLPEHTSDPQDRAFWAYTAVLAVAYLDWLWGLFAWVIPIGSLQAVAISTLSAMLGMMLLALARLVRRASVAALVTAIIVVGLDSMLGLVSLAVWDTSELAFCRIPMLLVMIGGVRATIALRKAEQHVVYVAERTSLPVQTASLAQRFLAAVIDLGMLGIAEGCWGLAGGLLWTHASTVQVQEWHIGLWGIVALAIPAVYFIWPYSTSGQTPGKSALRIKVVSTDGSPLGWRTGILRSAGYILSGMPFGMGFVWSTWQTDRQAGHDKIAGTLVVPASVTREHLKGAIKPAEVHRTQSRWLLGLGILSLFVYIGLVRQIKELRSAYTLPVTLSAAAVGPAFVAAGTTTLVILIPAGIVALLVTALLRRARKRAQEKPRVAVDARRSAAQGIAGAEIPIGWTDDLTIPLLPGRSVEEVVEFILQAALHRTSNDEMVRLVAAEFHLSEDDAALACDRSFGGLVRAATCNPANCPVRDRDPFAWESFQRGTRDPSLIARIYPPFASEQ